jgi:hypothetical protein
MNVLEHHVKVAAISSLAERKRSHCVIVGVITLLALSIALWLFMPQPNNPVFKRKRLSSYLAQLPATYTTGDGGFISFPVNAPDLSRMSKAEIANFEARTKAKEKEAREAIRMLGPRCLPRLLQSVAKKESASDRAFEKLKPLLNLFHIRISPNRTYTARWQAVTAVRELKYAGCKLDPLVPRLRQLSLDSDPDISLAARFLLRHIEREMPFYDYGRGLFRLRP